MPGSSLRVPTRSKPEPFFGKLARIGLIVVVSCAGLAWAGLNAKRGAASDMFRDIGTHLLKFETFSPATSAATLDGIAAQHLRGCDVHAQRALLLLEIPLAYAALQSGAVQEFDRRGRSLEDRARQALSCNPRDSLVWLVLFGLHTGRGQVDENAFDLLNMSYETSPYEAWIAGRRLTAAVPVILSAPEPLRERILAEFQHLVRKRFTEMPVRAYLSAPPAVRTLLQASIDQLSAKEKEAFAAALKKFS
ncbi:hypothetical protein [Bradyrhizobium roseum]|uniref:hypothetical protein n=1 Tax=Bradyrhizobium roseum TaxID=3056648 RepID=UPI0026180823|nr:hypothetical protein [Bradyrhizobium roseus]WKA30559.1 hypothetical protein QUH67_10495 [Bradyrhizobium roseus]